MHAVGSEYLARKNLAVHDGHARLTQLRIRTPDHGAFQRPPPSGPSPQAPHVLPISPGLYRSSTGSVWE